MKKKLGTKLVLNRETIRQLSDARLGQPVGGVPSIITCFPRACPTTLTACCTAVSGCC